MMPGIISLLGITFVLGGASVLAALKTRDTQWPFALGFFTLLPVTVVLAVMGQGAPWRRVMLCALVALYVGRMLYTLFFWFGATGASKLKADMGTGALIALPLVLVFVFGWLYPLPFFSAMNRAGPFDLWDGATLVLYGLGTFFHFGADYQKWAFRQRPENKGQLLRRGLWGLSRHPNYFGDFLIYLSFACASVWPWGLVAPLVNLAQYFADAMPKNEKMSATHYGAAWQDYCRQVPQFLPRLWPVSNKDASGR
ncbi:DUF1295 domain-containing protein [Xanthobacter sp. TB0139]|uniref:DUF1295 domain-containing protein n=1 Tax=Xanthobacter sp. TB0139 TaxID=3459178 RepID=UPI0040396F74